MKTRYNEHFESNRTPSRSVVEAYREVVANEDRDVSLALVHYRGTCEEYELGLNVTDLRSKTSCSKARGEQCRWLPKCR